MAAWLIRAGHDASWADTFIAEGRVCLGFGMNVSVISFPTLAAVQEWMAANAPSEGPRAAHSMWRLLHEVQVGDLVLMPSKPRNQEFAIGRITGGYELAPELVSSGRDPHTRAVNWLRTEVPGGRIVHLGLPPRGTISRLRSHNIEERLEELLS